MQRFLGLLKNAVFSFVVTSRRLLVSEEDFVDTLLMKSKSHVGVEPMADFFSAVIRLW
jgi:hypothetical protein